MPKPIFLLRERHLPDFTAEQPQYNMFHRDRVEREYARLYDEIGLGTTVWSPLASGLLTGKYDDGCPPDTRASQQGMEWLREQLVGEAAEENRDKVRKLKPIADKIGCTRAQLALAWCLKNPKVSTVITGASKAEQVKENIAALELVDRLTPEVNGLIEEILDNKPAAAPDYR